jgi:xylulokinase
MEGLSSDELETLLQKSSAGSDGARFRPLLSAAGGADLGPDARGAFTGLRLSHTREHLLRAVVEGLALELNRYLEFLLHARVPVKRLIMCGGAAGGDVTPQIISDVTGLPVECVTDTSTSALGAAVLARALTEPHLPLGEIASQMSPPKKTFEPGENSALYRAMFQQYRDSLADARQGDS